MKDEDGAPYLWNPQPGCDVLVSDRELRPGGFIATPDGQLVFIVCHSTEEEYGSQTGRTRIEVADYLQVSPQVLWFYRFTTD